MTFACCQSQQNPTILNSLNLLSPRVDFVIFWRIIYMSIKKGQNLIHHSTIEWWGDGTRQTAKTTPLGHAHRPPPNAQPQLANRPTIKRLMAISLGIISDIGRISDVVGQSQGHMFAVITWELTRRLVGVDTWSGHVSPIRSQAASKNAPQVIGSWIYSFLWQGISANARNKRLKSFSASNM